MPILNNPARCGLIANITAAILSTVLVNGLTFGSGLAQSNHASDAVSFAPPGWVIGCIWIALFAVFGAARFELVKCHARSPAAWLTGLMGWCLAYPLTSAGFDPQYGQLVNIVSLLFMGFVASRAGHASRRAGLLLLPCLLWLGFAVMLGAAILRAA